MKTSFKDRVFHLGLMKELARQIRTYFIVITVIMLVQAVFVPLLLFVFAGNKVSGVEKMSLIYQPLLLCVIVLLPVTAISAFLSFLKSRNGSDFYHALPVKRSAMIIDMYLMSLLFMVAVTVISVAAYSLMCVILPHMTPEINVFWILELWLCGAFFGSAGALAGVLTGTRFSGSCVMLMILFVPRLLCTVLQSMISIVSPVALFNMTEDSIFSFQSNIVVQLCKNNPLMVYEDTAANHMLTPFCVVFTLCTIALYFGLAVYFFVIRKSERAETASFSSLAQIIFRTLPAYAFCLIPIGVYLTQQYRRSSIESGEFLILLLFLYVVAVIIFLLYELLTTKSFKACLKSAKTLWILLALNVATIVCVVIAGNVINMHIPSPSQIKYVTIDAIDMRNLNPLGVPLSYREFTGNEKITNPVVIENISTSLKKTVDYYKKNRYDQIEDDYTTDEPSYYRVKVAIHTSTGTLYREINLYEVDTLINALREDESYRSQVAKEVYRLPKIDFERTQNAFVVSECYPDGYRFEPVFSWIKQNQIASCSSTIYYPNTLVEGRQIVAELDKIRKSMNEKEWLTTLIESCNNIDLAEYKVGYNGRYGASEVNVNTVLITFMDNDARFDRIKELIRSAIQKDSDPYIRYQYNRNDIEYYD